MMTKELDAMVRVLQAGAFTKFAELSKKTDTKMYDLGKEFGRSISQWIFASMD